MIEVKKVKKMEAEGGYAWRLAAVTMEESRCVKEDGGGHWSRRRGGNTGSR